MGASCSVGRNKSNGKGQYHSDILEPEDEDAQDTSFVENFDEEEEQENSESESHTLPSQLISRQSSCQTQPTLAVSFSELEQNYDGIRGVNSNPLSLDLDGLRGILKSSEEEVSFSNHSTRLKADDYNKRILRNYEHAEKCLKKINDILECPIIINTVIFDEIIFNKRVIDSCIKKIQIYREQLLNLLEDPEEKSDLEGSYQILDERIKDLAANTPKLQPLENGTWLVVEQEGISYHSIEGSNIDSDDCSSLEAEIGFSGDSEDVSSISSPLT